MISYRQAEIKETDRDRKTETERDRDTDRDRQIEKQIDRKSFLNRF